MREYGITPTINTAGKRIGQRIRTIRKHSLLTQKELGEKVGLTADRIQKYENGVAAPREDMIMKLAHALSVSTFALQDPVTDTPVSTMYFFFELEKRYNLTPIIRDNEIAFSFNEEHLTADDTHINVESDSSLLYYFFKAWVERHSLKEFTEKSDIKLTPDVANWLLPWEWNFPKSFKDNVSDKKLSAYRDMLLAQINALHQELEKLTGNDVPN